MSSGPLIGFRVAKACTICHARRVRCSGDHPCAACVRRGDACAYDPPETAPSSVTQPAPKRPALSPPGREAPAHMAEILAENAALRARVAALEAAAASLTADIKIEAVGADVSEAHAAVSAIFAHSRAETTFRLQPFNDQRKKYVEAFYRYYSLNLFVLCGIVHANTDDVIATLAGPDKVDVTLKPHQYVMLQGMLAIGAWITRDFAAALQLAHDAGEGVPYILESPSEAGVAAIMVLTIFHTLLLHKGIAVTYTLAMESMIQSLQMKGSPPHPETVFLSVFLTMMTGKDASKQEFCPTELSKKNFMPFVMAMPTLSALNGLMGVALLFFAVTQDKPTLDEEWKEFGPSINSAFEALLSRCVLGGDVVPWQILAVSNTFRAVFALRCGQREESLKWGLKAARNFVPQSSENAVLELPLLHAAVHEMEVLRRLGVTGEEYTKMHALVMHNAKLWPLMAFLVSREATRPDFLVPFACLSLPFPPLRQQRQAPLKATSAPTTPELGGFAGGHGVAWGSYEVDVSELVLDETEAPVPAPPVPRAHPPLLPAPLPSLPVAAPVPAPFQVARPAVPMPVHAPGLPAATVTVAHLDNLALLGAVVAGGMNSFKLDKR